MSTSHLVNKLEATSKGGRIQVSSGCLKSPILLNFIYPGVFRVMNVHKRIHTHEKKERGRVEKGEKEENQGEEERENEAKLANERVFD